MEHEGWIKQIVAEASALAPLTERDRQIMLRSLRGQSNVAIGGDYGLTGSRIADIVNRSLRSTSHALRCIRKGNESPDWQLMHMSNRLRVRLASNWDRNLSDLRTVTREDVLQWRNTGPVVLDELERLMESKGIKFREKP